MDRSSFNPQVGDDVRIRLWDDMVSEFGLDDDGNIPCRFSFCRIYDGYVWSGIYYHRYK